MLSRCLAIILLFALISSNFFRVFVYAGFEANQNYIVKELCVNKERPWMHCNGRCYLMNKLKEATEKEKKQEEKENMNRLQLSFFQQSSQVNLITPIMPDMLHSHAIYIFQYSSRYIDTIFRPPKYIA